MTQSFPDYSINSLFFHEMQFWQRYCKIYSILLPVLSSERSGMRRSTMNCPDCKAPNDADALFCASCGRPLEDAQQKPASNQRRAYFIALLFIPVVLIAVAIGYYKFYLPGGVAAVVNGEDITLSELDAAVARMKGSRDAAASRPRHQALMELISERLVLQEARKAGITVSQEELAGAAAEAQAASGLDLKAFNKAMCEQYGTMHGFENEIEHRIIIKRLIAERVVPPGADPRTAGRAVNQWLRDLTDKATVRIALAEQMSDPTRSCCNKSGKGLQNGCEESNPSALTKPAPLRPQGESILHPH
jgi:hypothetical protein